LPLPQNTEEISNIDSFSIQSSDRTELKIFEPFNVEIEQINSESIHSTPEDKAFLDLELNKMLRAEREDILARERHRI
jgi:hypothetical protein